MTIEAFIYFFFYCTGLMHTSKIPWQGCSSQRERIIDLHLISRVWRKVFVEAGVFFSSREDMTSNLCQTVLQIHSELFLETRACQAGLIIQLFCMMNPACMQGKQLMRSNPSIHCKIKISTLDRFEVFRESLWTRDNMNALYSHEYITDLHWRM